VSLQFDSGFSHADCDFAGLLPQSNHALKFNVLDEVESTIQLIKCWKDDEMLEDKIKFLKMTSVMKCGISSRKTTGRVVDVAGDQFHVTGNEVTPFLIPGDSGSLVLNQNGVVLGVVMDIIFNKYNDVYVTKVLAVWIFYDWLDDLRSYVY
jgi:hypothetical protein